MKKTITILLVLLVAAFAVFALDQTLTLQSAIDDQVDFTYGLGYKLSTGITYNYLSESALTATLGTLESTSPLNPGAAQTVNFKVRQDKRINVNAATSYTFSVAATAWVLNGVEEGVALNAQQTNAVTLGSYVNLVPGNTDNLHNVAITNDTGTVTVAYAKGITDSLTELVTFNATWPARTDLEAGIYTSTVTLTYTAV